MGRKKLPKVSYCLREDLRKSGNEILIKLAGKSSSTRKYLTQKQEDMVLRLGGIQIYPIQSSEVVRGAIVISSDNEDDEVLSTFSSVEEAEKWIRFRSTDGSGFEVLQFYVEK